MRKPVIAGNWKMYKDADEAVQLADDIKRGVSDIENVEIVVCPPFVDLGPVGKVVSSGKVGMGGQNCYWEAEGAYTGEVAVSMLKSVGCGYVIIGHSERRKYFGETEETVNKKIKAAIDGGLIPIVCVGETLEEREAGRIEDVVSTQVKGALSGFDGEYIKDMIIAYEPVWAIGTGKTATPDQAQEVHAAIRELLAGLYSEELSAGIRILYGGSVKPDNIEELMREKDIDGGLIGGASLNSDGFIDIIKSTARLYA